MRPTPALFFQPKFLLVLTTLLVLSAIISTAAVARSGQPLSSFLSTQRPQQQNQEQQQQQPPHGSNPDPASVPTTTSLLLNHVPPPTTPKLSTPKKTTPAEAAAAAAAPAVVEEEKEYKYFHEAGASYELTHYDGRFFHGALPYAEHRAALRQLIRSYLSVFASRGLETWLAHGTLLGWWWNGRVMPWDWDVDAQVSGETMRLLAEGGLGGRYNQTVYEWVVVEEGGEGERERGKGKRRSRSYLLDVNPFSTRVDRGNGMNVIDARWIDTETGMFVDITALMERDPAGEPGVVSCKNHHVYKREELYPLRETEFEGVTALVPWDFEGILVEEYGAKSLVVTEWEGHRWDSEQQEWVKINRTRN
ncbi:LicD family-domain-containing protein [Chaetomium strumarium]|uniref:LicD family-domain-containing protein n=1 Tax=Chaetomium strumarium TaxID=1170767 RepID=A0AAJ0GR64_9PEZI|nr:LicD family-domain-containing protein [Chaetomium strumarium]